MGDNVYDKIPVPVSIVSTTGTLPDGFVSAYIVNEGSANATITLSNGNTHTLKPQEELIFHRMQNTYDVVSINASNTTVTGWYTKF